MPMAVAIQMINASGITNTNDQYQWQQQYIWSMSVAIAIQMINGNNNSNTKTKNSSNAKVKKQWHNHRDYHMKATPTLEISRQRRSDRTIIKRSLHGNGIFLISTLKSRARKPPGDWVWYYCVCLHGDVHLFDPIVSGPDAGLVALIILACTVYIESLLPYRRVMASERCNQDTAANRCVRSTRCWCRGLDDGWSLTRALTMRYWQTKTSHNRVIDIS